MTTTKSLIEAAKLAGDTGVFSGVFYALGGTLDTNNGTEINSKTQCLTAFTLQNLGVQVLTNASALETLISRNNGANGNQSVSCTANTAGWFTDSTHTDSISAGNSYGAKRTTNAGQGNSVLAAVIAHTGPLVAQRSYSAGAALNWGTSVGYGCISSTTAGIGTEADAQAIMRAASTWQGFALEVTTSPSGTATNKSRKNTADGNQVVSVAASTGVGTIIQDSTHTDSIVSGDLLNFSFISTTASGATRWWSSEFVGTTSAHAIGTVTTAGLNTGTALSTGNTYFFALSGAMTANTTEANAKTNLAYAATLSFLRCNILSSTGTLTVKSRKNGADGNSAVSAGASATGRFEDSTHTDSYSALDDANTTAIAGGTTSVSLLDVMVTLDDGSVSGHNTETGTAVMTLAGISFAGSGTREETGSGTMTLAGVSFSGSGARDETGTGCMALSGVSFVGVGGRKETGSGIMALAGVSFVGAGNVAQEYGTVGLHLAGVSIVAAGFDLGTPGQGVRQFWTF